jgi:hypothetical protein
MSVSPSLSASLITSIIRMADRHITGQEYSDEDEDEDEGDDDESDHSDDGESAEIEGGDKNGSDEVEDSVETDDSKDAHVFIGVFNPRHSRGESTLPFRVVTRPDGVSIVHTPNMG